MNNTKKMVCPNGCNARFITSAHVVQEWYVDGYGNYLETAKECVETAHDPDFGNIWRCEHCDTVAELVIEPDVSAHECRLNLNFKDTLGSFYQSLLYGIPSGYRVDPGKVRVCEADYTRILNRLAENYRQRIAEMNIDAGGYIDIHTAVAIAMANGAPGVDSDLQEGTVRLLEGYIVKDDIPAKPAKAELESSLYMGVLLDREGLMSQGELLAYLHENGMHDRGIAGLREQQYAQYGKEIIWRYPLSGNSSHGGYVFPVKEGFLWIPYDEVESERGEMLVMEDAELLNVDGLKSLREDFASYSADLCTAFREAEMLIGSNACQLEKASEN